MVDTHELLQRIDLRALAEEAGARFRRDSSACPLHQGNNPSAFHLYRGEDGVWRWHCFTGCQTGGDAIRFYQMWKGVDFRTALAELAAWTGAVPRPPAPAAAVRVESTPPAEKWQTRCMDFLRYCQDELWENEAALRYLTHQRGYTHQTIGSWGLGYNPGDSWDAAAEYGLDDGKRLWWPQGIVIPGWRHDALWYVKIRRPLGAEMAECGLAPNGPIPLPNVKYVSLRGGTQALFGETHLANRSTLVFAEGEFDTILLHQVAGDLVDVVTLGGAGTRLSQDDMLLLACYPRIIASHDNDARGAQARARMQEISSRVVAAPPTAKDVTAMWRESGAAAVRRWVQQALEPAPAPTPVVRVVRERLDLNRYDEGWRPLA